MGNLGNSVVAFFLWFIAASLMIIGLGTVVGIDRPIETGVTIGFVVAAGVTWLLEGK